MTGKLKTNLCCHLLLPKNKSCVTQLLWRPRPGHWCSQGRNIWAVAEACGHYPRGCCWMLLPNWRKEEIKAQRWLALGLCITSKPCLHSNLRTLRLLALRLSQMLRFKDARKRRPRNRPYPFGLCWSAVVTNSSKERCPKTEPCLLKAQCGLNLSKVFKSKY